MNTVTRMLASSICALLFTLVSAVPLVFFALKGQPNVRPVGVLVLVGAAVATGLTIILVRLRPRITYLAAAGVLLGGLAWWQASDERDRPPAPEIGPVLAEASETSRLYRQFSTDKAVEDVRQVPLIMLPKKGADWADFARLEGSKIEAAWAADIVGRQWIEALAAAHPEGVISRSSYADPMLKFMPVRSTTLRRLAYAWLLSQTGRADEAIDVLIPALGAGYALQRSGGTLVECMIGTVVVGSATDVLERILDHSKPSEPALGRARAALEVSVPMDQLCRNLFLTEARAVGQLMDVLRTEPEVSERGTTGKDQLSWFRTIMRVPVVRPWIFHPNRTERLTTEFAQEGLALALKRDIVALKTRHGPHEKDPWRNPCGRVLLEMGIPNSAKITESVWEKEDRRLALLQRLAGTKPRAAAL